MGRLEVGMTREELQQIVLKAGGFVPKVIPLKKRDESVCLQLSFFCPAGKKELVLASDVTAEDAAAKIREAIG